MLKVTNSSISEVTRKALLKAGVNKNNANTIVDTILFANRRGNATHGIGRLPLYIKKIKAGHLNPKDENELITDTMSIAVIDAHNGFGQVSADMAVNIAAEKACKYGISAVGVKNSNNFGMAGYFGNKAALLGCAALIFANAAPAIAPTGGYKTIFGTNPICFSFPGTDKYDPIILDMATTVAARGKIRLAAKNGEKIPLDWAVGPDGRQTDDPNVALMGSLFPIGGYKGYGLSMFVDLFAGLMTGSAYGGNVKNLGSMDNDSRNGHLFILIDPHFFLSDEEIREKRDFFQKEVKLCGDEGKVLMPGERGFNSFREHVDYSEISEAQYNEINELADDMDLSGRLEECDVRE